MPTAAEVGEGEVPDLFGRHQPMLGFEDELELGHYFATEFQRWFEQFPAVGAQQHGEQQGNSGSR